MAMRPATATTATSPSRMASRLGCAGESDTAATCVRPCVGDDYTAAGCFWQKEGRPPGRPSQYAAALIQWLLAAEFLFQDVREAGRTDYLNLGTDAHDR